MIPADQTFIELEKRRGRAETLWFFTIGSYEVPQEDIVDPGSLHLSRAFDFDDIPTGDNTVILDNLDRKYSPGRSNFILGEGHNWYMVPIKIELGYRLLNSKIVHRIKLYEGYIKDWRLSKAKGVSSTSSVEPNQAEISSVSLTYALGQKLLGRTDTDGTRNPLVYGTTIKDAEELTDNIFWDPDTLCDEETGDFSSITTAGSGTFDASTTEVYAGTYSFKAQITGGGAADEGYGTVALSGVGVTSFLMSAMVKFTEIPGTFPSRVPFIMGVRNSAGTDVINIACGVDGLLRLWVWGPYTVICDLDINDILNQWVKLSLGADLAVPGTVRVYLDGQVIGQQDASYAFVTSQVFFGFRKSVGSATGWTAYFDDCKVTESYYPICYYLPGFPYSSINGAFRDGVIIPKEAPKYWMYRENRAGYGQKWTKAVYSRYVTNSLYTSSALYGFVSFTDISDPPAGAVLISSTKNATTHPVDIISGIIEDCGLIAKVDTVKFAEAEAVYPNDTVGSWFEDITGLEAIGSISRKTMYDMWDEQGLFKIKAYTAEPPRDEIMAIPEADITDLSEEYDSSNLRSRFTCKYGWYSKNKQLLYQLTDSEAEAQIGVNEEEINFEWSEDISSENLAMVQSLISRLRYRLRKPRHLVTFKLGLKYGRLELGDVVRLTQSEFWQDPILLEIYSKTYNMLDKTIELVGIRYLGEEDG